MPRVRLTAKEGPGTYCHAPTEAGTIWERLHACVVVVQEREMAHHKSNIGFFAVIGGSLLAAALLVALLVGGQVAGPKVAFDASSPITAH
jgi:hypothetical protein